MSKPRKPKDIEEFVSVEEAGLQLQSLGQWLRLRKGGLARWTAQIRFYDPSPDPSAEVLVARLEFSSGRQS